MKLQNRILELEDKQKGLMADDKVEDAKALDATIAELKDMLRADLDAEVIEDKALTPVPAPKAADDVNIRDIADGAEHNLGIINMDTSTTPGKEFVGKEWDANYMAAALKTDPLAGVTKDITTASTHVIPVVTGFGAAALTAEGASPADTSITAGTIELGANSYTYKQPVTDELMQDALYDVNGVLATGAGSAFAAQAFALKVAAMRANTAAVNVTAAAKSNIAADDLIKLKNAVPSDYRRNGADCRWIMSTGAKTLCELLKDANGRPIFDDHLSENGLYTINGIEVIESDAMDDFGTAGKIPVMFVYCPGTVFGYRGSMIYKALATETGTNNLFKVRMDAQTAPLPTVALLKTNSTDPV